MQKQIAEEEERMVAERSKTKAAPAAKIVEALNEATHPNIVDWETFEVDGKKFRIKPLTFNGSRLFRKWAVPVIADRMTPFETLLAGLTKDTLQFSATYGFLESVVESEEKVDQNVGLAVGAICALQHPLEGEDPLDGVDRWTKLVGDKLSRKEVVEIFDKQCVIEEEVGQLGKSLRARLESLAALVGKSVDLPSLLQGLMQRATGSSEKAGGTGTTSRSSAGSSTATP